MVPISVVICCANVQDSLQAACLSARPWAAEIVVVDSGSTDATAEIANQYADRYVLEPWRGYTGQKKFGASLAKHDWVFVLDGDEEISAELANEIQSLTSEQLANYDVLAMRRQTYLYGQAPRGWWPDWQRRLIDRRYAIWPPEVIHDDRLPRSPDRLRKLSGHLIHRRRQMPSFKDYFHGAAEDRRMPMIGLDMYQQGRRCRWSDLALRPPLAFVKSYVFKLGFLDGMVGLLVAHHLALGTQLKYAALWAAQKGILPPPPPAPSASSASSAPPPPSAPPAPSCPLSSCDQPAQSQGGSA